MGRYTYMGLVMSYKYARSGEKFSFFVQREILLKHPIFRKRRHCGLASDEHLVVCVRMIHVKVETAARLRW